MKRRAALIALPGFAAGCASLASRKPEVRDPPRALPLAHVPGGSRLALVLSGGSARGFAHIGVIAALEGAGIRPDLVVGTSAGSLVGALYASGMDAAALERVSREADGALVGDADWWRLLRLKSLGLFTGHALHAFVARHVGARPIEGMPIPFAAVATDMYSGAAAAFTHGDTGRAVHASCAIPGVFEPVEIGARLYGDGGLSSPLPARIARALGARVVVAVDVVYPPADSAAPRNPLDLLFQTFLIQTWRLKEAELAAADIIVRPDIPVTGRQYGFKDRLMLIAAGEAAGRAVVGAVRAALK
ncbi:MAG: patatin-like phospholipase family protein [Burkholderiales bacterium]|nr:patatin-like phospholipase family protein [Burkholderiales bacterium]